jgi:hypothetical protein
MWETSSRRESPTQQDATHWVGSVSFSLLAFIRSHPQLRTNGSPFSPLTPRRNGGIGWSSSGPAPAEAMT